MNVVAVLRRWWYIGFASCRPLFLWLSLHSLRLSWHNLVNQAVVYVHLVVELVGSPRLRGESLLWCLWVWLLLTSREQCAAWTRVCIFVNHWLLGFAVLYHYYSFDNCRQLEEGICSAVCIWQESVFCNGCLLAFMIMTAGLLKLFSLRTCVAWSISCRSICWVWHGVFFLDVFTYVQHLHPALGLGYACLPLTRLFGIVISDSWDLQHVAQSQTISWMCCQPSESPQWTLGYWIRKQGWQSCYWVERIDSFFNLTEECSLKSILNLERNDTDI